MDKSYNKTLYACFIGYIVQAIVNNFVPLLFLIFHSSYGIPMTQITLLITFIVNAFSFCAIQYFLYLCKTRKAA